MQFEDTGQKTQTYKVTIARTTYETYEVQAPSRRHASAVILYEDLDRITDHEVVDADFIIVDVEEVN